MGAGLAEAEVQRRRAAGQGNRDEPRAGRTYLAILVQNAAAPVNLFLFATCGALLWLGLAIDAAVTAVPVLLNIVASVALEARAKQQLDRLSIIARPAATVIRDGAAREVAPGDLVLGDLVVIRRGDQVVLDGEVVDGRVDVDESLLTGEAEPVAHGPGEPLLSGSACVSGRATYRVTRVGRSSYANQLVQRAREARTERTPLQRDVQRLVAASGALVLLVGGAVALDFWGAGELTGRDAVQAAAVLVAIVPQGLVIVTTLVYASGALSVSRAGALVQRINAVESMSRVDVLVVDKTGTLTRPGLALRRIASADREESGERGTSGGFVESAAGPAGGSGQATGDAPIEAPPAVRDALAVIAGESSFEDRTTAAIRAWLGPAGGGPRTGDGRQGSGPEGSGPDGSGQDGSGPRGNAPRSRVPSASAEVIAFASDRRWSGIRAAPGEPLVILAAPEVLAASLGGQHRRLAPLAESWAGDGLRVLVLALGRAGDTLPEPGSDPRLPGSVEPLAILGFGEDLRPDAVATLDGLTSAGLTVKVASGDHRRTVAAIAARVGIRGGEPLDGRDLRDLDDRQLATRADGSAVFGRVEPALKARLVRALRSRGHYVAMLGDGVNDIIALKEANLGLAMESGSPAARATADVVLLGDAFGVLPHAIVTGQRIVEGMRLVTCLLFTRTIYALLVVLGAALLSLDFPLTPRTNSILALLTVGIPTLVLAAWAPTGRTRTPLVPSALRFSVPAGIAVAALALPVYWWYLEGPGGVAEARSALTAVTVWCGILLIPFLSPPGAGRDPRPTVLAAVMALLFGFVLAVPGLRDLFEQRPLPPVEIAILALLAVVWAGVLFRLRALRVVARLIVAWRKVTGAAR